MTLHSSRRRQGLLARCAGRCLSWLRPRGPLMVALVATGALASCISAAPPRDTFAELRVIAEPDSTVVYFGGRFVGTARNLAKQPAAVRPGVVYATLKAPGYFPHDLRLDLPAGETQVKIKLRPIPQ